MPMSGSLVLSFPAPVLLARVEPLAKIASPGSVSHSVPLRVHLPPLAALVMPREVVSESAPAVVVAALILPARPVSVLHSHPFLLHWHRLQRQHLSLPLVLPAT